MMAKKRRKVYALILVFLAVYVCFSALVGIPLGFGKIMERDAAKNYCSIVYPQAQLGKTVFNPVGNGYETAVYLEGGTKSYRCQSRGADHLCPLSGGIILKGKWG